MSMSGEGQLLDLLNYFDEIDDCFLGSEEQDASTNNDPVVGGSNNINNFDETVMSRSFNTEQGPPARDPVFGGRNIPALLSDPMLSGVSYKSPHNLPVVQQLKFKIQKKLRAEGKEDILMDHSVNKPVDQQLTPEDVQKRIEKQERNKEAARKSRQKKRESDCKLKMDNKSLETENQALKQDVTHWKRFNQRCEEFLGSHKCEILDNVPQRDHGREICEKASSNQICIPDEGACEANILDEDKKFVASFVDSLDFNELHQLFDEEYAKLKLQDFVAELQKEQSLIVPSGSYYEIDQSPNNTGYNVGIQENVFPDHLSEVTGNVVLNVGLEAKGRPLFPRMTPFQTSSMVQNSSSYLPPGNPSGNINYENPWSTEMGNESEEREAFKEILSTLHPPPEKKPRLE